MQRQDLSMRVFEDADPAVRAARQRASNARATSARALVASACVCAFGCDSICCELVFGDLMLCFD